MIDGLHFVRARNRLPIMLSFIRFYILLVAIDRDSAETRRSGGNPRRRKAIERRPPVLQDHVDPWMMNEEEEKNAWRFLLDDKRMSMNAHEDLHPPTPASPTSRPPSAAAPTPRPASEAPAGTEPPPARCPSIDEPCMNEENFEICTELVESSCKVLVVRESCPLQFGCDDDSTPAPPTACPAVDEPCMNEENLLLCTNLVMNGCRDLLILESCPLQFQCGDDEYPSCGGIAGIPCEEGLFCYTGISDDCDEDCGAVDCLGECRQILEGEQCLGFAGFQCPDGSECVDEKGDGCSPSCGGADCIGICLVV